MLGWGGGNDLAESHERVLSEIVQQNIIDEECRLDLHRPHQPQLLRAGRRRQGEVRGHMITDGHVFAELLSECTRIVDPDLGRQRHLSSTASRIHVRARSTVDAVRCLVAAHLNRGDERARDQRDKEDIDDQEDVVPLDHELSHLLLRDQQRLVPDTANPPPAISCSEFGCGAWRKARRRSQSNVSYAMVSRRYGSTAISPIKRKDGSVPCQRLQSQGRTGPPPMVSDPEGIGSRRQRRVTAIKAKLPGGGGGGGAELACIKFATVGLSSIPVRKGKKDSSEFSDIRLEISTTGIAQNASSKTCAHR